MNRGKVIGAIVLVGVIGLVIAQRIGEPDGDITGGDTTARDQGGAAGTVAGQVANGAAGAGIDAGASEAFPAPGEVRVYTIDAAQSELHWRIYRAGAMARLGHNHVISIEEFEGSVTLASALADSAWELSFQVADLIIDDPALRARYGEDFESEPSEDDKAGTKTNMLTDRVLNGEMYSEIRLTGEGVTGSLASAQLPVSIQMLGRTIEQSFPASISVTADAITVEGEYRLTHADLGMEPFSLFGGVISVGEDLDFSYRIHAVAGGQ